jgi:hypothetical protein
MFGPLQAIFRENIHNRFLVTDGTGCTPKNKKNKIPDLNMIRHIVPMV